MKEGKWGEYRFRCGRFVMRKKDVMELLADTYWAGERPWAQEKKALRHSLPFGIFDSRGKQVGFARVLTDYATTFYLADVVVHKELRGRGIGKAFLDYILHDRRFCNVMGILLTKNAHGFYERFGFVRFGERCMLRERGKRRFPVEGEKKESL